MQKKLFQLIGQLDTQKRADAIAYITSVKESNPEAAIFHQDIYLLDTGISIDAEADPIHVFQEIESLLSEPSIDINAGMSADDWCTPIIAAARTGHLQLVQLLVDHGATISARVIEDNITRPNIFNYFLQVRPSIYTLDKSFINLCKHFEVMKVEFENNPESLMNANRCESLLFELSNDCIRKKSAAEEKSVTGFLSDSELLGTFGFLSTRERGNLNLVCHRWYRVASDSQFWNYRVKPEFRGDNAKLNFLNHKEARVNEQYLLQLIGRCNVSMCNYHKQEYHRKMGEYQQYHADRFFALTGLPITADVDVNQALSELIYVTRIGSCLDINLPTQGSDGLLVPLISAISTDNLAVVELMINCGATITDQAFLHAVEKFEIFNCLLDACPEAYSDPQRFDVVREHLTMMRDELSNHPDRLAVVLQCENVFLQRQEEFRQGLHS